MRKAGQKIEGAGATLGQALSHVTKHTASTVGEKLKKTNGDSLDYMAPPIVSSMMAGLVNSPSGALLLERVVADTTLL